MADELWTPEAIAKFKSLTAERQTRILDQLTEQEFTDLQAKIKPQSAPPTEPGFSQSGYNDLGIQIPEYAPAPSVGERILGGVAEALDPRSLLKGSPVDVAKNAVLGPLAQVPKVAEAIIQPMKEEYLNPAIAEWQKGNREDLGAGADPEALDK